MSQEQHHTEEHQAFIKTPKQLITVIVASFLIPIFIIVMLINFVGSGKKEGAGSNAQSAEAIAARIAPVAKLDIKDPNAVKVLQSGEAVYKAVCMACHATGAAGAPKVGDTAKWGPLIKEGLAVLSRDAIKGIRGMPAKGGNPDLDDIEVVRAIVYMANQSGAKFKEPEVKAAPVVVAAPAEAKPAAK